MSSEAANADGHERVPFGYEVPGGLHISLRGYLTGFALSVVLTAVPFWLVMGNVIPDHFVAALVIMALAGIQIVVHMIFFLHMGPKVEDGWSMMALLFTVIILAITLIGSLWVMYHLNANMMPMTVQDARQLP